MATGNKGEWSELYVLFKLLGEQRLYAGDGDLNRLKTFYPVLKILRDQFLEYSLNNNIVVISENGHEVSNINVSEFLEHSKSLFKEIQIGSSGNGAFEIPSQNDFIKKIHCKRIKAKTNTKADIHIIIHDYHTGMMPNLGFSIKSEAGANPTLLNASAATSFIYKIKGNNMTDKDITFINSIQSKRKMQDKVNALYEKGYYLEFQMLDSSVFTNNLRMIDSKLPEILGWMLINCYKYRDMSILNAVERITKENPFNYDLCNGHDFYGYKIKNLMVASALGMVPASTWNGLYDATGGYIVVKNDGDVICFHIFDRNLLEDYLFKNTKFETPSGKRYSHLGEVYFDSELNYNFNLNLQIRFK